MWTVGEPVQLQVFVWTPPGSGPRTSPFSFVYSGWDRAGVGLHVRKIEMVPMPAAPGCGRTDNG